MKFTIDRSEWLRGEGHEKSFLLRESDGKMCCLGIFSLACGLDPERITNVESPEMVPVEDDESVASLWEKGNPAAGFLFNCAGASNLCSRLMETNDEVNTVEGDREEEITKLFAQGGVEVEFVGE
jgi:hypothetical protein